jgi:transcriptional regulator with XRE-family HTH domain
MRALRTIYGMTQKEFAKGVGLSQSMVSMIECGKLPASGTRKKIADALNVPEQDLWNDGYLRRVTTKYHSEEIKNMTGAEDAKHETTGTL